MRDLLDPKELRALITVRNGLAAGHYVHVNVATPDDTRVFDMNVPSDGCGTVACIGGWMAPELGINVERDIEAYVNNGGLDGKLTDLFFPDIDWENITPHEAVDAIDNFLASGDPDWKGVRS